MSIAQASLFQSTPSAWRETASLKGDKGDTGISIHSLRMEGDSLILPLWVLESRFQSTPSAWRETKSFSALEEELLHFNPLPPHGGRLHRPSVVPVPQAFQSTPSAWRETVRQVSAHSLHCHFNPLPPHGGRRHASPWTATQCHFNPLPPHGGRLPESHPPEPSAAISIHSLRMEGDALAETYTSNFPGISIHSLRMEGDRPAAHRAFLQ